MEAVDGFLQRAPDRVIEHLQRLERWTIPSPRSSAMENPEPAAPVIRPAPEESVSSSAAPLITQGAPPSPKRLRRAFRRALRVLLWLILVALVAAGIYFGWPVVYDRYIRPVETNTSELTSLEARITAAETRLTQLDARAATIEASAESFAATQTKADDRLTTIEGLIAEHTSRLSNLDRAAADLATADNDIEASTASELGILRSMELLSRARLFLYQANYGLAVQDLTAARNLLADVETTPDNSGIVDETLFRIDLALSALPERPVAASDDLDIAWETLLGDLPTSAPAADTPGSTTAVPSTTTP